MISNEIPNKLIPPYGGDLVNLLVDSAERESLIDKASSLHSLQISQRAVHDLELLATGGFSPLKSFMGEADYLSVLDNMRLVSGQLWTIPITLPVALEDIQGVRGNRIALRDTQNNLLAVMSVDEVYKPDLEREALKILGSNDSRHPLVAEMVRWGDHYIAGELQVIALPRYNDFIQLRRTPQAVRELLSSMKVEHVVAFQTRNPMHRVHEELTKRAASQVGGALLIHPVVGLTKPGDVDHYTRCRVYQALYERYYDHSRTVLSLLPLAMRMAGPREAVWHATIRRNFGANHFVVGRNHAGVGDFFGPYDAQELLQKHENELGVKMVPFKWISYIPDEDRYEEADKIPENVKTFSISGTQVREEYLAKGKLLPEWFTRPETAQILQEMNPPQHLRGFCIWFTGLSGSGKSTTVEALIPMLFEQGRQLTILDGDVVRTNLSKGLGFDRHDRDANILRIGFVASEIVRHNGTVVCAAISPFSQTRNEIKRMIGDRNFIEVYVDTPLSVCEDRDVKGLYAKARNGEIANFTGISSPYEPPRDPDIRLDTVNRTPSENAKLIVEYLRAKGYLRK